MGERVHSHASEQLGNALRTISHQSRVVYRSAPYQWARHLAPPPTLGFATVWPHQPTEGASGGRTALLSQPWLGSRTAGHRLSARRPALCVVPSASWRAARLLTESKLILNCDVVTFLRAEAQLSRAFFRSVWVTRLRRLMPNMPAPTLDRVRHVRIQCSRLPGLGAPTST